MVFSKLSLRKDYFYIIYVYVSAYVDIFTNVS